MFQNPSSSNPSSPLRRAFQSQIAIHHQSLHRSPSRKVARAVIQIRDPSLGIVDPDREGAG